MSSTMNTQGTTYRKDHPPGSAANPIQVLPTSVAAARTGPPSQKTLRENQYPNQPPQPPQSSPSIQPVPPLHFLYPSPHAQQPARQAPVNPGFHPPTGQHPSAAPNYQTYQTPLVPIHRQTYPSMGNTPSAAPSAPHHQRAPSGSYLVQGGQPIPGSQTAPGPQQHGNLGPNIPPPRRSSGSSQLGYQTAHPDTRFVSFPDQPPAHSPPPMAGLANPSPNPQRGELQAHSRPETPSTITTPLPPSLVTEALTSFLSPLQSEVEKLWGRSVGQMRVFFDKIHQDYSNAAAAEQQRANHFQEQTTQLRNQCAQMHKQLEKFQRDNKLQCEALNKTSEALVKSRQQVAELENQKHLLEAEVAVLRQIQQNKPADERRTLNAEEIYASVTAQITRQVQEKLVGALKAVAEEKVRREMAERQYADMIQTATLINAARTHHYQRSQSGSYSLVPQSPVQQSPTQGHQQQPPTPTQSNALVNFTPTFNRSPPGPSPTHAQPPTQPTSPLQQHPQAILRPQHSSPHLRLPPAPPPPLETPQRPPSLNLAAATRLQQSEAIEIDLSESPSLKKLRSHILPDTPPPPSSPTTSTTTIVAGHTSSPLLNSLFHSSFASTVPIQGPSLASTSNSPHSTTTRPVSNASSIASPTISPSTTGAASSPWVSGTLKRQRSASGTTEERKAARPRLDLTQNESGGSQGWRGDRSGSSTSSGPSARTTPTPISRPPSRTVHASTIAASSANVVTPSSTVAPSAPPALASGRYTSGSLEWKSPSAGLPTPSPDLRLSYQRLVRTNVNASPFQFRPSASSNFPLTVTNISASALISPPPTTSSDSVHPPIKSSIAPLVIPQDVVMDSPSPIEAEVEPDPLNLKRSSSVIEEDGELTLRSRLPVNTKGAGVGGRNKEEPEEGEINERNSLISPMDPIPMGSVPPTPAHSAAPPPPVTTTQPTSVPPPTGSRANSTSTTAHPTSTATHTPSVQPQPRHKVAYPFVKKEPTVETIPPPAPSTSTSTAHQPPPFSRGQTGDEDMGSGNGYTSLGSMTRDKDSETNLAKPKPQLGLKHLPLLYSEISGGRMQCRSCVTRRREADKGHMKIAIFEKNVAFDSLSDHYQKDHPVVVEQLLKLSGAKIVEIKQRMAMGR